MIKYDKLLQKMQEAGLTTYRIRKDKIIGESTLTRIRNNEPINTVTLDVFCKLFNCQPGDLLEFVPDHEPIE